MEVNEINKNNVWSDGLIYISNNELLNEWFLYEYCCPLTKLEISPSLAKAIILRSDLKVESRTIEINIKHDQDLYSDVVGNVVINVLDSDGNKIIKSDQYKYETTFYDVGPQNESTQTIGDHITITPEHPKNVCDVIPELNDMCDNEKTTEIDTKQKTIELTSLKLLCPGMVIYSPDITDTDYHYEIQDIDHNKNTDSYSLKLECISTAPKMLAKLILNESDVDLIRVVVL